MMKKITQKMTVLIMLFGAILSTNAQGSPALQFNGSDNYIKYTEATTLFETYDNFTVEMWVKSENPAPGCLYAEGEAGSNTDQFRIWGSGGKLIVRPIGSSAVQIIATDASGENLFAPGKPWFHIAVVGTPGTVSGDIDLVVYVDGQDRGSATYARPARDYDNSLIGKYSGGGGAFDGNIDEFRAWSRSLDEIELGNNPCAPASTTGLVRHIRFNEGSGITAADETGGAIGNILGTTPVWTTNSSCVTASIADDILRNGIEVYPNPANDIITIKSLNANIQIKNLGIYDISGKLIYKGKASKTINIAEFSSGIFILKVESVDGGILHKKIIID